MIFDPATAPHLKPWLVRTLEPICDAEPGALADYILALLKHNVPESDMRKELAAQLDEFLEKECPPFIDTLFTVLRTKSYLPYSSSSSTSPYPTSKPLDTGIPIPLDGLLSPSIPSSPDRNRKRTIDNDERDGRPPAKGPRISTEGQFSRYTNGGAGGPEVRSTGGWSGQAERPTANGFRDGANAAGVIGGMGNTGMNGSTGYTNGRRPQAYQPPDQKRGICRDYHNSGYCARGAFCKYSHGEDAVVPGPLFPMNGQSLPNAGMPFMPMFPNGGVPFGMSGVAGAAYDPHEARMDMRPMGGGMGNGRSQARAPLLPRIQQEDGSRVLHSVHASGELPVIQDLTPNLPPDEAALQSQSQPQPLPSPSPHAQQTPLPHINQTEGYGPVYRNGGISDHMVQLMNGQMDVEMASPAQMAPPTGNHSGGFRGGMRGGGRGRGTFGGEVHNFRPERRNDKTLVVEKIPDDKLSLEHVNEWFKRFGTVTNVAIDGPNAKALVSFANHEEAHAAWKSEDAVFNNRFVKLFWHRPMEGHGQVGARMLAASAPLIANITIKDTKTPVPAVPSIAPAAAASTAPTLPVPSTSAVSRKSSSTSAALAAKQKALEQQIAEHQSLMASLATASADEKKDIMAKLRKLGEEMKSAPLQTPVSSTPSAPSAPANKNRGTEDHERKERERLDKELELHHATASIEGEQESTEDLKAKLERLKAEAASLGLAEGTAELPFGGTYRPPRGRGRGSRSYYRGTSRGGPPRASMKLDNRPKKLLVKGVSGEGVQALRDWYETTGQVESLVASDNGEIVVTFRTRGAAEQGLAKGHHVPTVGPIQATWYTSSHPDTIPVKKSNLPISESSSTMELKNVGPRMHSPEPELPRLPLVQEEEVVASGWGGDGDGEDGMGML